MRNWLNALTAALVTLGLTLPAAAVEPDLIFKRSTVWKMLTPDHKLAVYAVDDPIINGVACHYTVPEKGGVSGMLGMAEEVSDISLACRQVGPVVIKEKFEQGEEMFRERRSLFCSRRCASCAAVTSSAMCWSILSIPTS